MSKDLDLSLPSDVLDYLSETQFASTRAEPLSGGTLNFIFRLHLREPFEGRETLVLKHAKPWVSRTGGFEYSVERQDFEAKALQNVSAFLPENLLATVPKLHYQDPEAHVLVQDDCGPNAHNLKQLLRDGELSPENARQIGRELGAFLATVHREGSKDQDLMNVVGRNLEGKQLSAFATYNRLVDTLKGVGVDRALLDPPLIETNPKEHIEIIEQIARETSKAIIDADSVFTMGDFWTGNVVVRTAQYGQGDITVDRIFVIDWEVTKPGLPYLDFAQIVAELYLLRRFCDHTKESVDNAIDAFFSAYKELGDVNEAFARGAAAHFGAHLVAWTPRAGWEPRPKNRVREVVHEGIDYLLLSCGGKLEALKQSIIGPLL